MKQTNNAIKFLMAQYRAIFQNAYFKGLATAAVVTMGLAAGQARAAADDATLEATDTLNVATKTIEVNGTQAASGNDTSGKFKGVSIANGTLDLSEYTMSITGEETAGSSNKVAGTSGEGTLKLNTLSIKADKETKGLLVEGTADGGANLTATAINITKGILATKGTTSGGVVNANTLTIGGTETTTEDHAVLKIDALGTVGYALDGNGSSNTAPTGARDVANYTTVTLDKNSKLAATASVNTTILNAAELSINGGKIDVAAGSNGTDNLTINLAQGELQNGTITTVTNGVLNIKFAEGDFVKDSTAVEKTFTLTKGTLDLTGGMTLSGEGKLVVANNGADLTITAAGAGITLADKAAYAPKDVATAKAVAGKLPIKIGANGVLDFGSTAANLDALTFDGNAATTGNKIGLAATGIIKGDTLSLTKKLGTTGIVSGKTVNLGDSGAAQSDITVGKIHSSQTLNIGKNVKAQEIVLTAGDVAAINKAHKDVQNEATKKALIKADALAQTGSFGTVEGVTEGTLTIDASDGKLDVVNGTWTNNNVKVVLGGSEEATLTVGAPDTTHKTAAKLVFDNGSKLEITKGIISVGNSDTKVLSAELDISALEGENLKFTSGTITVAKNGLIKANSELLTQLFAGADDKLTIGNGGVLEIVDDVTIDALANLATSSSTAKKIHFGGTDASGATLRAENITINNAKDDKVNIGQYGVIEANTLTLNNDVDSQLQNVQLDAGKFVVKQTLTSEGSDLKATLGNANTVLELGKIVKNNGEDELASASGSSTLDLELGNATAALKVVGGQWGLQDVTVTNGTVTVGNATAQYDANDKLISAQVTGGKLDQKAGTVTINEGSSAKFTELWIADAITDADVKGVLTVVGQQNAKSDTNPTADFGASINHEVKVTGANAKLVIGTTALGSIASYQDAGAGINYTTDVDPLFGTNGKVSLDQFGTLELQFDKSTQFSLNDLASLRKGVTGSTKALDAGFISIGNASLTDSVVSGGTITAENLEKIKDFKDIVIKDIANATVTDVENNTVVTGNVGNIQAKTNVSEVKIGQATLNKANDKNQFAVDASGKQVNLAVNQGGYLHLVNDGEAKNITLANGVSETQKTNLVVKGKAYVKALLALPKL